MTPWEQYLADNSITTAMLKGYSAPEVAGLASGFDALGGTKGYQSPTSTGFDIQSVLGMKDGGLFGMSSDQMGMAGGLAGLAMQGFAMPSMMDAYKQQTKNLKQQYDFNKQSMADTKQFQNTWADASNSLAGAKKQTAVG